MDLKSDFLRQFQTGLDQAPLPEAVDAAYRLESCLSQDPQGSVWLIRRRGDGARLVLRVSGAGELREEFETMKRLPEDLAGRAPMAVDFFQEDGVQYLIRTYLPGRSLAEALEEEAWAEDRCAALGERLCSLLDRLHRLSPPIIHRDIKPENIILSPDGAPGLIDFGIARAYDPEQETDTVHMGTRATAAPEQYGFSQSDQRTDLYSLGVTLRWMVTGSYRPEALETADCSGRMKRFLRKAAAFDPADRFPTAQAMGTALARLAEPRKQRRRLTAVLAAGLCLAVLLGVLWANRADRRPVEFSSPLLEQAVRLELDIPEGEVTCGDLKRIQRLAVVGQNVLEPGRDYQYRLFGYLDGVSQEHEPAGDISDLSPLAEMPNLTVLYLCQQEIDDLSPLADLPLRELYLCDNNIADLSPLKKIGTLETLYLGNNDVHDLTPLASLKNLRALNLDSVTFAWPVNSLAPLAGLELDFLSAGLIEPLDGDWSPLGQLPRLERLWLWDPSDAAVRALGDCEALRVLNLCNYRHADLTGLPVIPALGELNTYSRLPSLEGVQKQAGLIGVSLCEQPGVDLSPLTELPRLRYFAVSSCPQIDYSPLLRCPALISVTLEEREAPILEADCPGYGFEVVAY